MKNAPGDLHVPVVRGRVVRFKVAKCDLKAGRGKHSKYQPLAFTEHGVVMLSSVLNSERAIEMSILVVQAFVRIRELMASNKGIAARVEKLERGYGKTASVIEILVEDIDRLAEEVEDMKALPPATKRRIGFLSTTTEPVRFDATAPAMGSVSPWHPINLFLNISDVE